MPSSSENPPVDIEVLMERIRNEVAQRRSLTPAKPGRTQGNLYTPGHLLRFGSGGEADAYLGAGWSHAESEFRWTDGTEADLTFAFEKAPGDLVLSFTARPFLAQEVEAQVVSAYWNNSLVGHWTIRENGTYHALILATAPADSLVGRLRFRLPNAFAPSTKGISADPRRLGLSFQEVIIRSARELGFQ